MEISSLFLYVAQPDDTISSIAKRFHTTSEEIFKYNPNLNSLQPYPGQPLNIKTNLPNNQNIKRPDALAFNLNTYLVKVAFYLKEAIISSVFCMNNIAPILHNLDDLFQTLFTNQLKDFKKIDDYKTALFDIVNQLIEFRDVIIEKNIEKLNDFKCQQDILLSNLMIYFDQSLHFKIDEMKNHLELWNLYSLKLISERYEEAQMIFLKILLDIDKLSLLF